MERAATSLHVSSKQTIGAHVIHTWYIEFLTFSVSHFLTYDKKVLYYFDRQTLFAE